MCNFQVCATDRQREERGLSFEDFKITNRLGEGTFGKVVLARKKLPGGHSCSEEVFAVKIVPKKHVSDVEKEVFLRTIGHPFLVQLLAYFEVKASCSFQCSMNMH